MSGQWRPKRAGNADESPKDGHRGGGELDTGVIGDGSPQKREKD